jgi:hypothetical protein
MADETHDSMVFYELLEDLESQFEDVEVEISELLCDETTHWSKSRIGRILTLAS